MNARYLLIIVIYSGILNHRYIFCIVELQIASLFLKEKWFYVCCCHWPSIQSMNKSSKRERERAIQHRTNSLHWLKIFHLRSFSLSQTLEIPALLCACWPFVFGMWKETVCAGSFMVKTILRFESISHHQHAIHLLEKWDVRRCDDINAFYPSSIRKWKKNCPIIYKCKRSRPLISPWIQFLCGWKKNKNKKHTILLSFHALRAVNTCAWYRSYNDYKLSRYNLILRFSQEEELCAFEGYVTYPPSKQSVEVLFSLQHEKSFESKYIEWFLLVRTS